MPPNRATAWLKRRLTQKSVLLCWTDRPAVFVSHDKGMELLQILMGDTPSKDKISSLDQDTGYNMKPDQRKALVQHFIVTDALLFAGFLASYGFSRLGSDNWPVSCGQVWKGLKPSIPTCQ